MLFLDCYYSFPPSLGSENRRSIVWGGDSIFKWEVAELWLSSRKRNKSCTGCKLFCTVGSWHVRSVEILASSLSRRTAAAGGGSTSSMCDADNESKNNWIFVDCSFCFGDKQNFTSDCSVCPTRYLIANYLSVVKHCAPSCKLHITRGPSDNVTASISCLA